MSLTVFKNVICFTLASAALSTAQAGYVCRTTCSGTVDQVIDGTYKLDVKFEQSCKARGGTVKSGGQGDSFGFDDMGCWLPDSFTLYGKTYRYCVVEERVQAKGFGLTAISKSGGGLFTASDTAYKSCEQNLSRAGCDGETSQMEVRDLVIQPADCSEILD